MSTWTKEIQAKSEEWTMQTSISDYNHLANRKIYVLLYSFALFYFEFEGNFQVQAPEGLYSEGRFNGGIFALRV